MSKGSGRLQEVVASVVSKAFLFAGDVGCQTWLHDVVGVVSSSLTESLAEYGEVASADSEPEPCVRKVIETATSSPAVAANDGGRLRLNERRFDDGRLYVMTSGTRCWRATADRMVLHQFVVSLIARLFGVADRHLRER